MAKEQEKEIVDEEAKVEAEETKAKAEAEAKAKAEEEAKIKAEEEAKAKVEGTIKLKVLVAFTDKYTDASYKIDDEIYVEKERAKELLADKRKLVEKL